MVNACFLEMGLTMYLSNLLLPCFASVFSVIFEVIKLHGINVTWHNIHKQPFKQSTLVLPKSHLAVEI